MLYFNSLLSADFQCPDTGVPVCLEYDDEKCSVTACICDFVWDSWKKNEDPWQVARLEKATQEWCDKFYYFAFDMNDAQRVAEKYDTWFR